MVIAFEGKESSVLCGDVSHSKAVISLERTLECLEVQLTGLVYISLSLLEVDPRNRCFDEARGNFLIKLLVDLSGPKTVRLHFLKRCVLNENVDLILG